MTSGDESLTFRRDRGRPRRIGPVVVLVVLIGLVLGVTAWWRSSAPVGTLVEVRGDVPSPGWHRLSEPTLTSALRAAGSERTGSSSRLHEGDRVVVTPHGVSVQPAGNPLLVALPVDVNLADAPALEAVPGIGAELAESILDDRARRGPFYSLSELRRVRGIGSGAVEDLSSMLTVGDIGPRPPPPVIDLNIATATELERLPGVGPVTAARIVVDREENGPYREIGDLKRVHGIGPATVEDLRDQVRVEP